MATVQLFATCLGDLIFPDAVADRWRCFGRGGFEVEFPARTGLLRPAGVQLGSSRRGPSRRPHVRARLLARGADRRPLGIVRDDGRPFSAGARRLRAVRRLGAVGVPRRAGGRGPADERGTPHRLPRLVPHAPRAARSTIHRAGCSNARERELVPLPRPDLCCGFGGTFSVRQPEVSLPMADDKLAGAAGAEALVTADPGCLMHLRGRAGRTGARCRSSTSRPRSLRGIPA